MRSLEAQLKVRLVERGRGGVKTTVVGQRLFEHAKAALELLAESERQVHQASGISGWLRLALPPTFEPWWTLLADFRRAHPAVKLDVFTSERRVDLESDGVDVAIRIGEVSRADYVARKLGTYRHVLVAAPAFLATHRIARAQDLLAVPCAGFRSSVDGTLSWNLSERNARPFPVLLANDYSHLRQPALAGDVLTELPPFVARPHLATGRLVQVLPKARLPEVAVSAVVVERRHTSALVRAYLDFCIARAKGLLEGE